MTKNQNNIVIEKPEDDPDFWGIVFSFGKVLLKKKEIDREAWNKNYKDYINTGFWKNKSEECKKRAGYKCQICNRQTELQVHHKTYERLGKEESNDLVVLCGRCHKKFHDILPR